MAAEGDVQIADFEQRGHEVDAIKLLGGVRIDWLWMKRVIAEELLDTDLGTADEVAASLESLRRVNRFYGGNRVHAELLGRVASRMGAGRMHVLEVASGHGDVL